MPMAIPPSAHTLRFGKVPASLERLHEGVNITPTVEKYTEDALEMVDNFEASEQKRVELGTREDEQLSALADALDNIGKEMIAFFLDRYLAQEHYGPIETIYQAIKAQPTFALREENDPLYDILAKAFKQFKQSPPQAPAKPNLVD